MDNHNLNKKRLVIVGLPNTGKSQVFNNLTGGYTLVANYPLTTLRIKRSQCTINGEDWTAIDTPGFHGLYAQSEDELAVRNFLFEETPNVILQCIDANRLKQSLTLTADLLELDVPLVITLNMMDETTRTGFRTDSEALSRRLGVQVIESIAVDGIGTGQLESAISETRSSRKKNIVHYGDQIEKSIADLLPILQERVPHPRKTVILYLMNDPFIRNTIEAFTDEKTLLVFEEKASGIKKRFYGNLDRRFLDLRSRWADEVTENTIRKTMVTPGRFSEVAARLSRHPIFGLPILAIFVMITYFLVTTVAGAIADAMNNVVAVPAIGLVQGFLPAGFWTDLFVGEYGLLTLGFFNAICTVLPILSVFFLMLGFIEDIGYLPNMTVLTKRLFERIGLSGKAIMPLVLGFGCKTMATLTTKSLKSRKERYIAIYLIALAIPCAAQTGIEMAILGKVGFTAFLIAFGTLFIVEVGAGFVLNKVLKEERRSDFIQELPNMRLPNLKALIIKTYYRLRWFLKEALPMFIVASFGLFLLDVTQLLRMIKIVLSPLVTGWLGLPIDTVDPLILSMARHEVAAAMLLGMVEQDALNYIQSIVAVVLVTMFVPCFNNVVAMIKELGLKAGLIQVVTINASAFLVGGILNWILILLL